MRRHTLTAAVLACLISLLVPPAALAARSEPLDQAEADRDAALTIVDAAVANRAEIEAELFATLQRYEQAARTLAAATADLDRVTQSLVFADAGASELEGALAAHAVTAYMRAVAAAPALVLGSDDTEDALVIDQALRMNRVAALADLDELLARRRELENLRTAYEAERRQVSELSNLLGQETDRLEALLADADAELADAFRRAREAEAAYREAVDAVGRARAAEEERRRREAAAAAASTTTPTGTPTSPPITTTTSTSTTTSTTTTSTSTSAPPPTTATTEDPAPTTSTTAAAAPEVTAGPTIQISSRTRSWLPLLQAYFPADLVEDSLVIVECESGGDSSAVNPYSGAAGLFQFLPGTWAVASVSAGVGDSSPLDAEANIAAASWLAEYYRSRGYDPWQPWYCRVHL